MYPASRSLPFCAPINRDHAREHERKSDFCFEVGNETRNPRRRGHVPINCCGVACAQVTKQPTHKPGYVNSPADAFGICHPTQPTVFYFSKRQPGHFYWGVRLRPLAPNIFRLWAASLSSIVSRRRSVTTRRNREFSRWSTAIRSSPLRVRLAPSAFLRHRCKVATPTPSVRAISLCSFPCLAKSFACASFVATSTLECRFIAACPAAITSISSRTTLSIAVF
jgi:hypothetical protein